MGGPYVHVYEDGIAFSIEWMPAPDHIGYFETHKDKISLNSIFIKKYEIEDLVLTYDRILVRNTSNYHGEQIVLSDSQYRELTGILKDLPIANADNEKNSCLSVHTFFDTLTPALESAIKSADVNAEEVLETANSYFEHNTVLHRVYGEVQGTGSDNDYFIVKAKDGESYTYHSVIGDLQLTGEMYLINKSLLGDFTDGDRVLLVYSERTLLREGEYTAEVSALYPDDGKH